ncbi:unnamed protein product [Durusdinium trenchii]|uniref:3'-5' exonuclease domain-containing protein n=1 Tax=Durusdinium trenchii TaxID=1381693 RepID=A0ABP0I9P0_9DINO
MSDKPVLGWPRPPTILAAQVLQLFLEDCSEESTQNFLEFLTQLPDETISFGESRPEVLKCQVILAFAEWIEQRLHSLDELVLVASTSGKDHQHCKIMEYMHTIRIGGDDLETMSSLRVAFRGFVYHVVLQLLGSESSCIASALARLAASDVDVEELRHLTELLSYPSLLLSYLVMLLEHCRAKAAAVALELVEKRGLDALEMRFCRHFSVDLNEGDFLKAEDERYDTFQHSSNGFSIVLVDCYGSLMSLLRHIESIYTARDRELTVAVDFEGVRLSRSGQLCLVQLTCSDVPSRVYVLDVHVLPRSLHIATPKGLSIKTILEDPLILKIWFDPRNDVDALYHQFGIEPHNIFDLQLAEVAARRSKGLTVNFVFSLQKCLAGCDRLDQSQKSFAEFINKCGKQLFEPEKGGSYEIFQKRPLLDQILVYAAHDSRYLQLLYAYYELPNEWNERVRVGSQVRARWYMHQWHMHPTTDAPDF